MMALRTILVVTLVLCGLGAASAGSPAMNVPPAEPVFDLVQYGRASCGTWQRNCAALHGPGTPNWQQCMNQPGAIRDCGGYGYDDGYGGGGGYRGGYGGGYGGGYPGQRASCSTWQRNCAALHGPGTRNWHQCMGQPGAIRDCGGY